MPDLLSRRAVAARLACSVDTVIRLEKRGKLRPFKLTGGRASRVSYRTEEVEALLKPRVERAKL